MNGQGCGQTRQAACVIGRAAATTLVIATPCTANYQFGPRAQHAFPTPTIGLPSLQSSQHAPCPAHSSGHYIWQRKTSKQSIPSCKRTVQARQMTMADMITDMLTTIAILFPHWPFSIELQLNTKSTALYQTTNSKDNVTPTLYHSLFKLRLQTLF